MRVWGSATTAPMVSQLQNHSFPPLQVNLNLANNVQEERESFIGGVGRGKEKN